MDDGRQGGYLLGREDESSEECGVCVRDGARSVMAAIESVGARAVPSASRGCALSKVVKVLVSVAIEQQKKEFLDDIAGQPVIPELFRAAR